MRGVASLAIKKSGLTVIVIVAFLAMGVGIVSGETWTFDIVDYGLYVGVDTNSLVLDDSGHPHVAYSLGVWGDDLKYAYYDGTAWIIQTVDSIGFVGRRCSLALDSNNYPHISYYDFTNGSGKYAWYDGSNWQIETVEFGNNAFAWSSIALDSTNMPHIAYMVNFGGQTVKYAWKDNNGVWQKETVETNIGGHYVSLALDSKNNPHVSYLNWGSDDLKYATKSGGQWISETIDTEGGSEISIAVDSNDKPGISYRPYYGSPLKYAYKSELSWEIQFVEVPYCFNPSITFDESNQPHISYQYHGAPIPGIKYAYYDGQSWKKQYVESGAASYVFNSIALDRFGNPYISYAWNDELRLASKFIIKQDIIPPITNYYLNGIPSQEPWYARQVHVNFTAFDDEGGSGVQNIYYSLDVDGTNWVNYSAPFVLNTEGQVTLWFKSVDNAGNEEEPRHLIFNIDTTAPNTTCTLDGVMGDNGWYVSNVTVTLSATDNEGGSGVKKTEYSFDEEEWITYTDPFIVSAEGLTTLYYRSEDNAGIIEVTIVREDVKIDTVAPVTTVTHTGTPNTGYSVSFSSSGGNKTVYSYDNINWAVYDPLQPLSIEDEGTWTVYYRTIDEAGNLEPAQRIDIIIDKTPPDITGYKTPSPNGNDWYNSDVTVHFEASDPIPGSGLDSVTPDKILTSDGEGQSVTGIAMDMAGNSNISTVSGINIDKTPPIVNSIQFALEPYAINSPVQVNANYTELNPDNAIVDWGDGSALEEIDLRLDPTIQITHVYNIPSIYTLTVTVIDLAGNSDSLSSTEFVVVYDPEGGFVTGGGWIDSPEGSYLPDPVLTGKATFGFVSKYKKGATVPTGQTEFQFKVADLNFHSDSYDWLVIAGAKAQYKGVGTINGEGEYGFMLTAIDADLTPSTDIDKFRIKICDKATEEIVYDNQMGSLDDDDMAPATAIGGGSIVIHTK